MAMASKVILGIRVWAVAIPVVAFLACINGVHCKVHGAKAPMTFPHLGVTDDDIGVVNVVQDPFNADPTGGKDSTTAIQEAIDFAWKNEMTVFIPAGTYMVTDTLNCTEHKGGRFRPNVIVGEVTNENGAPQRPILYLPPRTLGFMDPNRPKYVIHFWEDDSLPEERNLHHRHHQHHLGTEPEYRTNVNFNQILQSVNIRVGYGNIGGIGVRLRGAQGSNLENVGVDLGDDGLIGVVGASGSGGSHAGLQVVGGKYGLDFRMAQPAPTLTGAVLVDQRCASVIYSGLQTLTIVGLHVQSYVTRLVPDILGHVASVPPETESGSGSPWMPSTGPCALPQLDPNTQPSGPADSGQISLVDSIIDEVMGDGTAVTSARNVYMNNVYMKGVKNVALFRRGSLTEPNSSVANPCATTTTFCRVGELAYAVQPPVTTRSVANNGTIRLQYSSTVWQGGEKTDVNLTAMDTESGTPGSELYEEHLWDELNFPTFQSSTAVNVKNAPYNATGDGVTDDTAALQKAILENEIVFLPKGQYLVSRTLQLLADTKLIGVGRTLSIIRCAARGLVHTGDEYTPVVATAAGAGKTTVAFLSIVIFHTSAYTYGFNWQTYGDECTFRQAYCFTAETFPLPDGTEESVSAPGGIGIGAVSPNATHPLMVISGGGNFYTLENEDYRHQAPSYRHLLIQQSTQGARFYQLNTEHGRGDANTEIQSSSNVQIYGMKSEGNYPVLWIRHSSTIALYGYGGNAASFPLSHKYPEGYTQLTPSLFRLQNCTDTRLINLIDYPRVSGGNQTFFAGQGFDPHTWSMVYDDAIVNGTNIPVMERPVLYYN